MDFNQEEFNQFIVDNNVVGFFEQPIKLSSGRISHWYVNWRINDVFLMDKLSDFVIAFVKSLGLQPDCFYGVPEGATKLGIITQHKWAKQSLSYGEMSHVLPMGRGKPKEHGDVKDRFFVGEPGGKVVVIEDVTTTGGSLIETLRGLKEAGTEVIGVISLTNRMEKRDDGLSVKEAVEREGFGFYNMSSSLELLPMIYNKLQPEKEIIKAIEAGFKEYGVEELKLRKTVIDKLLEKIDEKKNPCVVGLDPQVRFLPSQIKKHCLEKYGNNHKAVAEAYIEFNKAIIDATYDLIPAFKLNMCFYEKYGSEGLRAFQETAFYVRSKGCMVLEDAKRNEVSESAKAYAEGHLGEVDMCDDSKSKSLDVDIMVVNPYFGSDGINPFFEVCKEHGKGIFILTKTSNPSSGELQDRFVEITEEEKFELMNSGVDVDKNQTQLYNLVALQVNKYAQQFIGARGYSPIGAVVGATYPEQAEILRKLMPNSFFLVPGYGTQGGGGEGVVPCFNKDGYGAVVNSSRGIIFAHEKYGIPERFAEVAREATKEMIRDIVGALARNGKLPEAWKEKNI